MTDHFQQLLENVDELVLAAPNLSRLQPLQKDFMHRINRNEARPFLLPLLPRVLTDKSRIATLFMAVQDYAENTDTDPIHRRDAACSACDEFESEAHAFGTTDADRILGELARQLKSAVASHFDSLEAGKRPSLTFSPIAKKYPLGRLDESIVFKIRIMNNGTGPARDLRLDEVISDDYLTVQTSSIELGTIQAGASFILDILATVRAPSSEAKLLAQLSWTEPGSRTEETREFLVAAQRDDVAWDKAESTEPYSLDAITTGSDLIGRKEELIRLLRLANSKNVGSGFIYGQKRVGKTSLANAVVESLESSGDPWVVISKGSGDYVGIDASSTLQTLGEVLVQARRIGFLDWRMCRIWILRRALHLFLLLLTRHLRPRRIFDCFLYLTNSMNCHPSSLREVT